MKRSMKLEQYNISCPWCGCQLTLDNAEYYGKLDTHKVIYRCISCQSQWANGKGKGFDLGQMPRNGQTDLLLERLEDGPLFNIGPNTTYHDHNGSFPEKYVTAFDPQPKEKTQQFGRMNSCVEQFERKR